MLSYSVFNILWQLYNESIRHDQRLSNDAFLSANLFKVVFETGVNNTLQRFNHFKPHIVNQESV